MGPITFLTDVINYHYPLLCKVMITFPLLFHYFSKKSRFEIVSVKNPFLRVSLKPTDLYGQLQNLRTTTKPTDLTLKPTDLTKLVPHTSTDHYRPLNYLPLRTWP